MKKFLKKLILPLLHTIRKIISIIVYHTVPSSLQLNEIKGLLQQIRRVQSSSVWEYYKAEAIRDSYNHFKKYFSYSIFLPLDELREYSLNKALQNHKPGYYYLEFGVWKGTSINKFSEILKDIKIYGFDSFEGISEDWIGHRVQKGYLNLNGQIPRLNDNCVIVKGLIQNTLTKFISENKDIKINFVHIDTDTYSTTKFILQQIKPHLINGTIIIFDEFWSYAGWRMGEYKALIEVFKEEEYKFLVFAKRGSQVVIQYNKI